MGVLRPGGGTLFGGTLIRRTPAIARLVRSFLLAHLLMTAEKQAGATLRATDHGREEEDAGELKTSGRSRGINKA